MGIGANAVSARAQTSRAPDGRPVLERAYREIERGRLREAIEVLERSVEMGWESTAVRTLLGIAYARTRQVERAFEHFERAVARDPEAFAPRCALGELFLRLCIFDEARLHLERALACAADAEERSYAQRLVREGRMRERQRVHRPSFRQPLFAGIRARGTESR
jgi:tetratricopeptide (TPR) repeat protein